MRFQILCSVCKSKKIIEMPVNSFEEAKDRFSRDKLGVLLDHGVCSAVWEINEISRDNTGTEDSGHSTPVGTRNVPNGGTEKSIVTGVGFIKKASGNSERN